jgi:hypothetical protein
MRKENRERSEIRERLKGVIDRLGNCERKRLKIKGETLEMFDKHLALLVLGYAPNARSRDRPDRSRPGSE